MTVRTKEERAGIIESGKRLGRILEETARAVRPGVTTRELDLLAERLIRERGDEPAFKGYQPDGAGFPFPATLCVSVNDEVVHGIPGDRALAEGDIVALDLGLIHKGFVTDAAVTVAVGSIDLSSAKLIETTRTALDRAIAAARPSNRVGDISNAIGATFEGTGISIVTILGGHGVGRSVHEEPYVANDGHPGTGPEIAPGMVLAIEPIANGGDAAVALDADGYTYKTRDGSRSAHFEHSILIEEDETIVLTMPGS